MADRPTPLHKSPPPQSTTMGPETEEGSSPASAPVSRTSRVAQGVFVADPGPSFDQAQAARDPAPDFGPAEPPMVVQAGWEEDTIRSLLTAEGQLVHSLAGVADDDWLWLKHELDAIAPPLCRIMNRYPALAAAAEAGDTMAVIIALGGHATRSVIVRRAELAAQAQEQGPEPVTGVHAPAGTGPDPQPQETQEMGAWQTASQMA